LSDVTQSIRYRLESGWEDVTGRNRRLKNRSELSIRRDTVRVVICIRTCSCRYAFGMIYTA